MKLHAKVHANCLLVFQGTWLRVVGVSEKTLFSYYLCLFVCLLGGMHMSWGGCMWKSEDNSWGLVLTFCNMGPEDRTQVTGLGSKRSHLSSASSPQ